MLIIEFCARNQWLSSGCPEAKSSRDFLAFEAKVAGGPERQLHVEQAKGKDRQCSVIAPHVEVGEGDVALCRIDSLAGQCEVSTSEKK